MLIVTSACIFIVTYLQQSIFLFITFWLSQGCWEEASVHSVGSLHWWRMTATTPGGSLFSKITAVFPFRTINSGAYVLKVQGGKKTFCFERRCCLSTPFRWLDHVARVQGPKEAWKRSHLPWLALQLPWRWFRQSPGICLQQVMVRISESPGPSPGAAGLEVSAAFSAPGPALGPCWHQLSWVGQACWGVLLFCSVLFSLSWAWISSWTQWPSPSLIQES